MTHVYIHAIETKVPGHRYAQGDIKDRILSTLNGHHEPSLVCSMAFGPGLTMEAGLLKTHRPASLS